MLFESYQPDIREPAATVEQLLHHERVNKKLKYADAACISLYLSCAGIITSAMIYFPAYFPIAVAVSMCMLVIVFALLGVVSMRDSIICQLSPLNDCESIELANLLANTKNPEMLRFAEEVKRQRRCFRRSELQALRLYAETATTKEAAEKAREYLYQ